MPDWTEYLNAIVLLFAVANVLPILPVVLRFTEDVGPRRSAVLLRALALGNSVAVLIALGGGAWLAFTGLTVDDVRVAGGLVLLVFSIHDLLFSREQRKEGLKGVVEDTSGDSIVPLGLPLLVGPATLATALVISEGIGRGPALVALAANAAVNGVILVSADAVARRMGAGFLRAVGKVMGLALVTLAVGMIRAGMHNTMQASG